MAKQIVCDRCGEVIGYFNTYEIEMFGKKYELCSDCYRELKDKFREWLKTEKDEERKSGKPTKNWIFGRFGGV